MYGKLPKSIHIIKSNNNAKLNYLIKLIKINNIESKVEKYVTFHVTLITNEIFMEHNHRNPTLLENRVEIADTHQLVTIEIYDK